VRLSGFNRYIPDYPSPGSTLVYNTWSGGFVVLDQATRAALDRLDAGDLLPGDEALIDADYADPDVGVVVRSREDEEAGFARWYAERRRATDSLSVVVATTFACNLRCSYCFQGAGLSTTTMAPAMAEATADWIAARATAIGAGQVSLHLTGGEPLLRPDLIEALARRVRARLPSACELELGLISNGVLVSREQIRAWVDLGLRSIQITLDGDESTHIRSRPDVLGRDTFRRSFDAAVDVADLVRVTIRGNYSPDNLHGFAPLLAKLRGAGLPPGSRVAFFPVLAGMGAPPESAQACTWSGAAPELRLALADLTLRAGYDPGDLALLGPCAWHQDHRYAVDPSGRIYKCPGFMGHTRWAVGDVVAGLGPAYDEMCALDPLVPCASCAHRPACGGGCLATAWLERGEASGICCEAPYFDDLAGEIYPRKYAVEAAETRDELLALLPPPLPIPAAPNRLAMAEGGPRWRIRP
jgi:uncharacterized protein